jgi:hypothetical protein
MQRLLRKGLMTVLGLIVVLGWWTLRDRIGGKASAESYSHIPARVWDGGGGKVTLVAESSDPGKISASFEPQVAVDDSRHRYLETWETVGAGRHTFTVEVPASVGGTVELDIPHPNIGSTVRVAVEIDGRVVAEDSETLDSPLKPGYAFFAQVELEDYATGKPSED